MSTTSAMPPKKSNNLRRRPETPILNVAQLQAQVQTQDEPLTADPNSPPETPTTSPPFSRKTSLKPRRQPDFHDYFQPLDSDPNIRPVGDGHQFSYRPSLGPEQLSPRSSSSSGMADDDSSDEDSSSSEDEDESASPSIRSMGNATGPAVSSPIDDSDVDLDNDTDSSSDSDTSESDSDAESEKSEATDEVMASHITIETTATVAHNFTLEDVDPMDSDCDGLDVLQPTEIESNRSRSRSRSRHRKEHKTMVKDFRNLNCSNETSETEPGADPEGVPDEEAIFLKHRERLKRIRRMSMGSSFGKRTHSELSDSEDDGEGLDANEVGSSARRMRRKMHRTSLLFHDPLLRESKNSRNLTRVRMSLWRGMSI
ncbi:hypothetical protein NXS19_010389 [Fusarium pseudograminearum]|nr:hypothetical protein NXS19_010389 [Fusarium pseudograminearum]